MSIPLTGCIGVVVRAVERGALRPDEGTEKLYYVDEVGARQSASLVKRAERLINEAAQEES